MQCAEPY